MNPRVRGDAWWWMVAIGVGVALAPSCKTPEVSFELNVPGSVASDVKWFEIGVYPSSLCPGPAELAGGIAVAGTVAHLAFPASDPAPPALGDLAKSRYAFAATARKDDCTVLATGCAVVDVNDARDIAINLAPTSATTGACQGGNVCNLARCVPGSDNSNPSVGAGCSLAFMGAGPLGDPLSDASTVLSAPVIAATDAGFLIAYREYDPSLVAARLTVIAVDAGGGAQPPQTLMLPGACASSEGAPLAAGATSLAFDPATMLHNGLVALARPGCAGGEGGGAGSVGIDFIAVDSGANLGMTGFKPLPGNVVSLGTAHALAATPGGYTLALTVDGQAFEASAAGVNLSSNLAAFGGTPPMTASFVTSSAMAVGLLALGVGAPAPSGDGGMEGGSPGDAGGPISTLRANVAAPGSDLSNLPGPTVFPGNWGSLSAVGNRVLAVSDGTVTGKSVAFRAFDVGSPTPTVTDGFDTQVLGKVVYADVALHQDHAFFAVEVGGMTNTISLVAYNHVSTTPEFTQEQPFGNDLRIPIGDVRDGLVSVAATDTRVAVVWGTGQSLSMNDTVGGFAVFACTP